MKKTLARALRLTLVLAILAPMSLPAAAYAYHDDGGRRGYDNGGYSDCDPEYEDCYNYRGDDNGSDWSNRDNDNRHRRSFSPGPFDRSPIDMRNACISLDCSGREKDGNRDQPPPD